MINSIRIVSLEIDIHRRQLKEHIMKICWHTKRTQSASRTVAMQSNAVHLFLPAPVNIGTINTIRISKNDIWFISFYFPTTNTWHLLYYCNSTPPGLTLINHIGNVLSSFFLLHSILRLQFFFSVNLSSHCNRWKFLHLCI